MSEASDPRFFATAAKGTEGALRDELRELRFREVRADRGGVHFGGDRKEAFRACLELRIAVRVLERLAIFDAYDGESLYEGVKAIDWQEYVDPRRTLAVRASAKDSALDHTQFIAQKTKDAIVDQLRDALGERPSVDKDDPDLLLFVHVVKDVATLYLDHSGEALHRRGYRMDRGEAPIKENLAAAMLRLGGWDRKRPLVDPMCGAGTIAIEAALWANDVAPGLSRERFGFERWACHDERAAKIIGDLRTSAWSRTKPSDVPIEASDVDLEALHDVKENATRAGVKIVVRRRDVREITPTVPPGHVVTNPPYDERLAADLDLYNGMGRAFAKLRGHRVTVLAGAPAIARAIPMRPERALAIWNGDLECRLLSFDVRD